MKFVYNVLLLVLIAASMLVMPVASTFAAPGTPVAVEGPVLNQSIEGKIEQITEKVRTVARPMAVLSLVIIALAMIAAPAFREWAQENKGRMAGVLFGIVLVGLSGDIVELMFS